MKTELPRSIPLAQVSITAIDLHVFADASIVANYATVYAVFYQSSSVSQGLVTSKSRISKHNITILRLKLISTHVRANLVQNVKISIRKSKLEIIQKLDRQPVVLYWLNEKGNYKQLAGNRVNKIREKEFINWYYVPTKENPADIGSRGSLIANISRVWKEDPSWLPDETKWTDQSSITSATEFETEINCTQELVTTAIQSN